MMTEFKIYSNTFEKGYEISLGRELGSARDEEGNLLIVVRESGNFTVLHANTDGPVFNMTDFLAGSNGMVGTYTCLIFMDEPHWGRGLIAPDIAFDQIPQYVVSGWWPHHRILDAAVAVLKTAGAPPEIICERVRWLRGKGIVSPERAQIVLDALELTPIGHA